MNQELLTFPPHMDEKREKRRGWKWGRRHQPWAAPESGSRAESEGGAGEAVGREEGTGQRARLHYRDNYLSQKLP